MVRIDPAADRHRQRGAGGNRAQLVQRRRVAGALPGRNGHIGVEEFHIPGKFLNALKTESAAHNENVLIGLLANDPAGTKVGVDKACELLKAAGAKRALPLAVSAPFHSSLMKPAAQRLRDGLSAITLSTPRIAVINNIDAAVQTDPQAIREALYRQAFGPVRWVEVVQALRARGLTHVLECGPGKVLTGLNRRIEKRPDVTCLALEDVATLDAALAATKLNGGA